MFHFHILLHGDKVASLKLSLLSHTERSTICITSNGLAGLLSIKCLFTLLTLLYIFKYFSFGIAFNMFLISGIFSLGICIENWLQFSTSPKGRQSVVIRNYNWNTPSINSFSWACNFEPTWAQAKLALPHHFGVRRQIRAGY